MSRKLGDPDGKECGCRGGCIGLGWEISFEVDCTLENVLEA